MFYDSNNNEIEDIKSKLYTDEEQLSIKILGIGGAGCNIVTKMNKNFSNIFNGITTICIDTDITKLYQSSADIKLNLGQTITNGSGTASNIELAKICTEESKEHLINLLEGTDLLFVVLGLGGGTGSGAGSIVTQIAKELDILTIVLATNPFKFEGNKKEQNALIGLQNLQKEVNTIILASNKSSTLSIQESFENINNYFSEAISSIIKLFDPKLEIAYAQLNKFFSRKGFAYFEVGYGNGVLQATKNALNNGFSDTILNAKQIIINASNKNEEIEIKQALSLLKGLVYEDCNIIFINGIKKKYITKVIILAVT